MERIVEIFIASRGLGGGCLCQFDSAGYDLGMKVVCLDAKMDCFQTSVWR